MYKVLDQAMTDGWALYHGDSVEVLQNLPDDCIHLSVFSPPFGTKLYTYTPTERDLGNGRNDEEFMEHFDYIIAELLRATKPGRVAAIHCMDLPATKTNHGWMGLIDFSGEIVQHFVDAGWQYQARIPIDKNQQAQAIRTKTHMLTMTQMNKDRNWIRPALPDYILKFLKPGENDTPVVGGMTGDEWIELANPNWPGDEVLDVLRTNYSALHGLYAQIQENLLRQSAIGNPEIMSDIAASAKLIEDLRRRILDFVPDSHYPETEDRCADVGAHATWYGIDESDTLQGWQKARTHKDELHVCPLQLGTIERCVKLWSNEGEIVLDPFAGIGSTGYVSLLHNRRFVGMELKDSYYNTAVNNLKRGQVESGQEDLFSLAGIEV